MNHLTISFLKHAADYYSSQDELITRIREELLFDSNSRLKILLEPEALFLSMDGHVLDQKIRAFFSDVNTLSNLDDAEILLNQLNEIERQAQILHKETLVELNSPGQLDPEKIHLVYSENQLLTKNRIKEASLLELFRIVAADPDKIGEISHYHYVHPDIASQYNYYKQKVYPVLESISPMKRFGLWAYQYKENAKIGNIIRMPIYLETEIKTERIRKLLPGENECNTNTNNRYWYGVGVLTNLTPNNIEKALSSGIHNSLTSDMIPDTIEMASPNDILDMIFQNEYYAVEPNVFFSELSIALCAKILKKRRINHCCIYCGERTTGAMLCESCLIKIRRLC